MEYSSMKLAPLETRMVNVKSTSPTNEERVQPVLNGENMYVGSKKRHIGQLPVIRLSANARSQRPDAKKQDSRQKTIPAKGKVPARNDRVK